MNILIGTLLLFLGAFFFWLAIELWKVDKLDNKLTITIVKKEKNNDSNL